MYAFNVLLVTKIQNIYKQFFISSETKAFEHKHSGNNERITKLNVHHYLIKDEASTQLENSIRKKMQ